MGLSPPVVEIEILALIIPFQKSSNDIKSHRARLPCQKCDGDDSENKILFSPERKHKCVGEINL